MMSPMTKVFLIANAGAVGTLSGRPMGGAVAAGLAKGFIHHLEAEAEPPSTRNGDPQKPSDTFDHRCGNGLLRGILIVSLLIPALSMEEAFYSPSHLGLEGQKVIC